MTKLDPAIVRIDVEYAMRRAIEKKCAACSLRWDPNTVPETDWSMNRGRWGVILGVFYSELMRIDPAYRVLDPGKGTKKTLKQALNVTMDQFSQAIIDAH